MCAKYVTLTQLSEILLCCCWMIERMAKYFKLILYCMGFQIFGNTLQSFLYGAKNESQTLILLADTQCKNRKQHVKRKISHAIFWDFFFIMHTVQLTHTHYTVNVSYSFFLSCTILEARMIFIYAFCRMFLRFCIVL